MLRTIGFGSGEPTACRCISEVLCISLKMIHLVTLNEDSCNSKILVMFSLIAEFSRGHLPTHHPGRKVRAEVTLC